MTSTVTLAIEDPRWTTLAAASPDALPFHHPAWVGLLADCYGFRPLVVGLEDAGGGLCAGVPVIEIRHALGRPRWVSLPFTDRCPVLAHSPRAGDRLVSSLPAVARAAGVDHVELRTPLDTADGHATPGALGHRLRLSGDTSEVNGRVHASHRRNVRAAQRHGVTVRHAVTEGDVTDDFYRLHVETRKRQGTPVQPRRYFRMLWERVIEPGLGMVLLADHGGVPIAGAVFLTWSPTVVYKYGASSASARSVRPNDLLMWHAIEWSVQQGRRAFDFGRTAESNEGLARFKRGWGADETELPYHVFGPGGRGIASREVGGVVHTILQKAPTALVRVAGELFYRFAA